jgi:hypothetical protein
MALRAGFKKKLRLYVELKIYDKNRQNITGPQCVNSRRFVTLCLFHLHRRVDMKCVRVESYVVEGGTDRPSPLCGGFAGSSPVVDTNDRFND